MNRITLETLVHRYFEGETTIEEEKALRAYFQENKPETPEMAQVAAVFGYMEQQKNIEIPTPVQATQSVPNRRLSFYKLAVAASLFLAASTGTFMFWNHQKAEAKRTAARERLYEDHYEDPEQALREVQAALALVSRKMDKGNRAAAKGISQVGRLKLLR
jgi:hypothetical protein